uniref:Uncharacterized protein n=1 Tax=Glossina austeni TaxID=7395 RepID=A0A1A9UYJ3_GLOAU
MALMTSPLGVNWAISLRQDEFQACLGEFVLDTIGSVQKIRRRWAQFMNKDHQPEVVTRLLELQTELEALTRQRSLSPPSHARNVADGSPMNKKGFLHPPKNVKTLHVPVTAQGSDNKMAPSSQSTIATTTNDTRETIQLATAICGAHLVFPTATDTRPIIEIVSIMYKLLLLVRLILQPKPHT